MIQVRVRSKELTYPIINSGSNPTSFGNPDPYFFVGEIEFSRGHMTGWLVQFLRGIEILFRDPSNKVKP